MKWSDRRRWTFSLRTLFVVVTIFGGWLAYYYVPIKQQGRAIAELKSRGFDIHHDYELIRPLSIVGPKVTSALYSSNVTPPGWPWARRLFGGEFFQKPTWIMMLDKAVSLDDMRLVGQLPSLREIAFVNCTIGDKHLEALRKCSKVQVLILQNNQINDVGLASLSHMRELAFLSLARNPLTGVGFKNFTHQVELSILWISDCPITDAGAAEISKLTGLHKLSLRRTQITDMGIQKLASLKNLEVLHIGQSPITEAGLLQIQETLPNCQIVRIPS